MTYVDGFVLSIEKDKIEEYREMAEAAGKTWLKHGALEYKECIADDMEDKGFCATFPATFKPKPGEVMVFAYITYKSREHRDEVNQKVHNDPEMKEGCNADDMPFDMKRMCYGGFKAIVECS
tara:strand:- start:94 stop:459 length:366 start_codon:yes stop_codon:yes gene_type:complete